jgi:hypothetical protein
MNLIVSVTPYGQETKTATFSYELELDETLNDCEGGSAFFFFCRLFSLVINITLFFPSFPPSFAISVFPEFLRSKY